MRTGFTYAQEMQHGGWESVDTVVNLAARDLNAREEFDFDIEVELIGDETTFDDDDARLYELQASGYDNTIRVATVEGEGVLLDSYSPCDEVFHEYGESLGRVMRTSPADWP